MSTVIFNTYEEFKARKNKKTNGISPLFLKHYPDARAANLTNEGCWNCLNCQDCTDCICCLECIFSKGLKWQDHIHYEGYEGAPFIPYLSDHNFNTLPQAAKLHNPCRDPQVTKIMAEACGDKPQEKPTFLGFEDADSFFSFIVGLAVAVLLVLPFIF